MMLEKSVIAKYVLLIFIQLNILAYSSNAQAVIRVANYLPYPIKFTLKNEVKFMISAEFCSGQVIELIQFISAAKSQAPESWWCNPKDYENLWSSSFRICYGNTDKTILLGRIEEEIPKGSSVRMEDNGVEIFIQHLDTTPCEWQIIIAKKGTDDEKIRKLGKHHNEQMKNDTYADVFVNDPIYHNSKYIGKIQEMYLGFVNYKKEKSNFTESEEKKNDANEESSSQKQNKRKTMIDCLKYYVKYGKGFDTFKEAVRNSNDTKIISKAYRNSGFYGNMEVLEELFQHKPDLISSKNGDGYSALYFSIQQYFAKTKKFHNCNYESVIIFLIKNGSLKDIQKDKAILRLLHEQKQKCENAEYKFVNQLIQQHSN
ncbi:MAG: hypothetical protein HRT87_00755 [Legionellales bacterium]|nr:hypothetical protein [Legionellales bacterium]